MRGLGCKETSRGGKPEVCGEGMGREEVSESRTYCICVCHLRSTVLQAHTQTQYVHISLTCLTIVSTDRLPTLHPIPVSAGVTSLKHTASAEGTHLTNTHRNM